MRHHIAIFCQVVDNYGDIGFCWRLARQLVQEYGQQVTLWVDDFASFRKICSALGLAQAVQDIDGVAIRHWRDAQLLDANVVIEAFACHLPPQIEAAMLATRPKWINLEYLSAEGWVEACHGAPSPQSSGLSKYFFFPGFSKKTGGLLCERVLSSQRAAFLQDQSAWWQNLGWQGRPPQQLLVSLFCYPHAATTDLFDVWQQGEQSVLCLIPEGIVSDALTQYCQTRLRSGERYTSGMLTLQIIPFTDQTGYDRLLWACDINFVRGEDSFVRAQWAAQPFVWHIYPQAEDIHLEKLQAFLQRYQGDLAPQLATEYTARLAAQIEQFSLAWNRGDGAQLAALWPQIVLQLPQWRAHASAWAGFLAENGDLADNLLQFIAKID